VELGEPISYVVRPGLGIEEARTINIMHTSWEMDDYALSYARAGRRDYKTFIRLKEEYGYSGSIILKYCEPGNLTAVFKDFREGSFTIPSEEVAEKNLKHLAEIGEYTPLAQNKIFALALIRASKAPGYDPKQMVKKIALFGETLLHEYANIWDALRSLEEVYNYRSSEANRLRLY
jgi:hypothetical protein